MHVCESDCAYTFEKKDIGIGMCRSERVTNPFFKDGLCEKNGQEEDTCIYIESFDKNDHQIMNPDEIVIPDAEYNIEITYPLSNPAEFIFRSDGGFSRLDVINNIVGSYRQIYAGEEATSTDQTYYFNTKCDKCETHIIEPTTYIINENTDSADVCSICLEEFVVGFVSSKLVCGHIYHKNCIDKWFGQNPTCPLCNKSCTDTIDCGKCSDGKVKITFVGKVLPTDLRSELQGGLLNRPKSNGAYGIWGHDIGDLVIERLTYDSAKKELEMFIGS